MCETCSELTSNMSTTSISTCVAEPFSNLDPRKKILIPLKKTGYNLLKLNNEFSIKI